MKSLFAAALAGSILASFNAGAQPGPDRVPQTRTGELPQQAAEGASSDQHWLKDQASGCAVIALNGADSASWSGRCESGRATGTGTLTLSAQSKVLESLSGAFDKGVLRDGHVAIKWPDGSTYDGNAVAGQMQGAGVLTTAAGDRFEGLFAAGKLSGHGVATWANGDRYDGDWRDGKATGRGVQVWADGRKYDGDWRDDLPNGHGIATRKDGSSYEGEFSDGQPKDGTQKALEADAGTTLTRASAVVAPAPQAHPPADAAKADDADNSLAKSSRGQTSGIAGISGKKFFAIDGSSLRMIAVDDGMEREITAPNGAVKKNVFEFLNDKVGSVSEGDDSDDVVGVFRLTEKGLVTEYGDGRSESLYPNTEGGVSMQLHAPTGEAYCMAWYPQDHRFSVDERKAALAAYANHLGIEEPKHGRKPVKPASKPNCGTPAAFGAANVLAAPHHAAETPVLTPIPRPPVRAALAHARGHTASALPASFTAPSPHDPHQPIDVRTSTVHLIDADAPPVGPATAAVAAIEPPAKSVSASTCLSVESDGQHWSFRNHCGYDVQFAYCLMNATDPLASCTKGAVSGSVSPNGTSALIADKSLSETNADHDFRWVACGGGAGEVVVHLDQSDPPAGRCVRLGAS